MGIVFQKSCLLVPDARIKESKKKRKDQKLKRATRRKLMARRRQQFDSLVEEARVWMYAMLLPTEIIANHNTFIKTELDNTINELTVKLLGKEISKDKVTRVCGRITRNILIHGLDNIDQDRRYYYPPEPQPAQIRHFLDDKVINAGLLDDIYQECPDFQRNHCSARTWREIREAADPYTYRGEKLTEKLESWQLHYTHIDLGLPYFVSWSDSEKQRLSAKIASPDPNNTSDLLTKDRDLVFVVAQDEPHPTGATATMQYDTNIMTLHPAFFSNHEPDSLRHTEVVEGTDISKVYCDVTTFLHEITHSNSILGTFDHRFRYRPYEIDVLPVFQLVPDSRPDPDNTTGRDGKFVTYGLEACLALVRRDERDNTNRAEDCAENWAFYFMLRMLILIYPELDIISALDTPDPFNFTDRKLQERLTPLHHCTLFQPLRCSLADIMHRSLVYDFFGDYWAMGTGRPQTQNIGHILEVLQAFALRQEKKSERNRDKRARRRARAQYK